MKIDNHKFPKSSFLSIDKDYNIIINKIMKNDRLKKLLYFTSPDALNKSWEDSDGSITSGMFGKNIKIVPKITVDNSILNYIIINFDNFTPNAANPEFRDNILTFDIICHFDQWQLDNMQLRPYKIAGEIDSMFNNQKMSGIGKLNFIGANQLVLTDEYAGITLMYEAIHGTDDQIDSVVPGEEEDIIENFNKMFNS